MESRNTSKSTSTRKRIRFSSPDSLLDSGETELQTNTNNQSSTMETLTGRERQRRRAEGDDSNLLSAENITLPEPGQQVKRIPESSLADTTINPSLNRANLPISRQPISSTPFDPSSSRIDQTRPRLQDIQRLDSGDLISNPSNRKSNVTHCKLSNLRVRPISELLDLNKMFTSPMVHIRGRVVGIKPENKIEWIEAFCKTCQSRLDVKQRFCSQCCDSERAHLECSWKFKLLVEDENRNRDGSRDRCVVFIYGSGAETFLSGIDAKSIHSEESVVQLSRFQRRIKRILPSALSREGADSEARDGEEIGNQERLEKQRETPFLDLGIKIFVNEGIRNFALVGTTLGGKKDCN